MFYVGFGGYALALALAVMGGAWAGAGIAFFTPGVPGRPPVAHGARGAQLVSVLRNTALTELGCAVLPTISLRITGD
jgi:hypothetical protein